MDSGLISMQTAPFFVGIVWKLSRVDHCRGTNGHKEITIGNGVDRLADYIFRETVSEPHDVRAPQRA